MNIHPDTLKSIQYDPPIRPGEWCLDQPCVHWGDLVISQPTSSLLVYLLAGFYIWLAIFFLRNQSGQSSRFWWGISLLMGGLGAAVAGTSYQAFGYMIKCAGQEFCSWTSWWEIAYDITTVAAASALVIGISYSSLSKVWHRPIKVIAFMITIVYSVVCLYGAFTANRFLVSFECMLLFSLTPYIAIFVIHGFQFFVKPSFALRRYLGAWGLLLLTLFSYFFYLSKGYTAILWSKGIWFSENDVLHLLMLIWCFYIYLFLFKYIEDRNIEE